MEKNRQCRKTSNGNKHKNSRDTGKNPRLPTKKLPEDGRMNIKIPKKAKIYEMLVGNNQNIHIPKWRQLDMIYEQAEQNKEQYAIKVYDMFIECVAELHPDKIEKLNKLRPLIIKRILKGETLDESYYDMIKEL